MVNIDPLAAEIDPVVWGTTTNFNGFRVLAALLHGIEQRAPPVFGSATITLGIGPHSSYFWLRGLEHYSSCDKIFVAALALVLH